MDEYKSVRELPRQLQATLAARKTAGAAAAASTAGAAAASTGASASASGSSADPSSMALIRAPGEAGALQTLTPAAASNALALRHKRRVPKAKYHPPWKLMRVRSPQTQ